MVRIHGAVKVDQKVEITDEFSARAWLGKHDHQTQVWFAARCALRALPYLGSWAAATKSGLTFASFRAAFTAAAAATYLNSELVELRKSAIFAAKTATATCMETATAENDRSSHYHAASFSAMQSHAAAAAAASTNTAEAGDAAAAIGSFRLIAAANSFAAATSLDANDILKWNALWGGDDQPPNIAQAWKELKAQWDADDADWSFWIEWYEGILNGTPLPWAVDPPDRAGGNRRRVEGRADSSCQADR
ncbi:hypothetical protein [Roseobacter sp. OBYS 0001]|uniref:hypothetical protein n=1 Tax=Roseobacter sp. OBYS 0001 TaxID=882651 RepID=UPI001BC5C13D|nr:hypothetical protein [Roseobacter sp. OBYS 0001]GIT87612.1 hypothetical protein ROBYS_26280 [Roseobacter sp. OBYS 0001]